MILGDKHPDVSAAIATTAVSFTNLEIIDHSPCEPGADRPPATIDAKVRGIIATVRHRAAAHAQALKD